MRTYGPCCPIARGAEVFAERWTPLIIRNLYLGNALRRDRLPHQRVVVMAVAGRGGEGGIV
jgi:DNA-binding HxlR family transcriptional regulator